VTRRGFRFSRTPTELKPKESIFCAELPMSTQSLLN
jgi:hypothetical protein